MKLYKCFYAFLKCELGLSKAEGNCAKKSKSEFFLPWKGGIAERK